MNEDGVFDPYRAFAGKIEAIDSDLHKHMAVNVSLFFKKSIDEVMRWPPSEIAANYVNVLYYNKKMKENNNGGN